MRRHGPPAWWNDPAVVYWRTVLHFWSLLLWGLEGALWLRLTKREAGIE